MLPSYFEENNLAGILIPELVRLMIQHSFGYECCQMLGNMISENPIKKSPLTMALADTMTVLLRKRGCMSVSLIDSFLPLPFLALLMEFLILIRRGVCLSAQEMERGAGKSLPKI